MAPQGTPACLWFLFPVTVSQWWVSPTNPKGQASLIGMGWAGRTGFITPNWGQLPRGVSTAPPAPPLLADASRAWLEVDGTALSAPYPPWAEGGTPAAEVAAAAGGTCCQSVCSANTRARRERTAPAAAPGSALGAGSGRRGGSTRGPLARSRRCPSRELPADAGHGVSPEEAPACGTWRRQSSVVLPTAPRCTGIY